ncbi:putative late blight resistance protein homolog R1A-3 [Salvia hispanica]|uniref:putative late blight resistance protein homolog R1A-3 n=1 Tax=Salvia hispanica TaxID=49212 RepID=UPI0020099719|nr:putative late blight resistance protein homolog R1A-3 [Salvia hispanica]
MGTYEADSKIQVSRVIKLWVSEGFLKPIRGKSLERVAKEYLDELVDRNLVLVHEFGKTGNMKYLKMHDLLRDLCLKEAEKERFYHVVGQHSTQGMCSQRRVVILQSTSKEKVVDVRKSVPYARSYKSDHGRVQPLPHLKLLRILKASHFVEDKYSPAKMLNLRLLDIHYLVYRQLSSSINLLWSIQTFIVSHCGKENNAPVEIWNMSQLRHVYISVLDGYHGRGALHLPDPPSDSIVIMENLQTLKGVRNFKCDETMVRRIPNIRKLGLIGSLDDVDASIHNIHCLQKLESLSCEHFNWRYFSRNITFPHSLKSLTLGTLCGRMEDVMEKVSTLPLLQKLKLSYGDFTTGKWETVDGQFPSLKYLSLAWCYRLECWRTESSSHFPCLEHLHLSSLAELKEIPAELGEIPTLKSVVLYECSESAVKSAKRMVEEQEELQGEEHLSFKVTVKLWRRNEELHSLANPNFQVTS